MPSFVNARWVKIENFDQERVFRFRTLCQWCVKFLPRIFYPYWAPHGQKLRIGRFDSGATKWYFWPACDQNLGSVLLRCDHGSNLQNSDLERLRTFTPMVPKVSLQDFLPISGTPWPKFTNRSFWPPGNQMVLLTGMRPKLGFGPLDHRATISLSRYFDQWCD